MLTTVVKQSVTYNIGRNISSAGKIFQGIFHPRGKSFRGHGFPQDTGCDLRLDDTIAANVSYRCLPDDASIDGKNRFVNRTRQWCIYGGTERARPFPRNKIHSH